MAQQRTTVAVTILNGQSLSNELNVGPHRIIGVQMPAAWTGAGLFLQALVRQPAGSPPVPLFSTVQDNAGADLVLATAPAADDYIALPESAPLKALGRIKVGSGTGAAPVAQGAQRDFSLVLLVDG